MIFVFISNFTIMQWEVGSAIILFLLIETLIFLNLYVVKDHESFVSHESLEQLHRLMFVLGATHVSYSFIAIALAMIKVWPHPYYYNFCCLTIEAWYS